jgi:hypothetical protein
MIRRALYLIAEGLAALGLILAPFAALWIAYGLGCCTY